MLEILHIALAFPAVLFTVLLGVAVVYWVFVILGALDIDVLGGGDIDLDGLDGAADGVLDGADAGAADAGVLSVLGLRKVPLTVSISILALLSWVICLLLVHYMGDAGGLLPGWLLGILILAGSLFLSVPLTSLACRPLAPIFEVTEGKRRTDYIGSTCTVTTGRVDATFGQARVHAGGDVLDIQVRSDRENAFSRNQQALIIDYDESRQAYLIETMDSVLGKARKR